jgi:hypothetical protein
VGEEDHPVGVGVVLFAVEDEVDKASESECCCDDDAE